MERKPLQPLEVFYCYAREDRSFYEELNKYLVGLRRSDLITTWHDGAVSPGTAREREIETHLSTAHIILLLISPNFLASDYCYDKVMPYAVERYNKGETRIIPIILSPVNWIDTPVSDLQALPTNKKPITSWSDRNKAFEDIEKGIRQVVQELQSTDAQPKDVLAPGIQTGPIYLTLPPATSANVREKILDYTSYISEKTRDFVGREFIFDPIEKFIKGKQKKGYFLIEGKPGAGKTSLAAQLVKTQGYVHHFNIQSAGIRRTDLFLRNVCTQLIAKYELKRNLPTNSELENNGYLIGLLQSVSNNLISRNERAIIVIDALDEVDDTTLASGATVLYLPSIEQLPDNIYIVATVREKAPVKLPVKPSFYIDPDSPQNRDDIRKYIIQKISGLVIQQYIKKQNLTEEAFVRLLEGKSQGNFMYLRHVLPAIEEGMYNDRELSFLPDGLMQYYEEQWERMHGTYDDEWFNYKLPVLMALAAAEFPLTIDMIQEFSGVHDKKRVGVLLGKRQWGQFLIEAQERYSIYHASFQNFLMDLDELKDI